MANKNSVLHVSSKEKRETMKSYVISRFSQLGLNLDRKIDLHKSSVSLFHNQYQFNHLRKFYSFEKAAPLQPFTEDRKIRQTPNIEIENVCQIMDYPLPVGDFPYDNYFTYDEVTAIPYKLLSSDLNLDDAKILGQAYTTFSDSKNYENFVLADLIDKLLFSLNEQNIIDLENISHMKYIGIGFGGFILQTFVSFFDNSFNIPQSLLLINSFAFLDSNLISMLKKSVNVFSGCPEMIPDLPYNYFAILVNSKELSPEEITDQININPIKIAGRLILLNTFLSSYSIQDRFQETNIFVDIYHSLKNCIVNINQVDFLNRFFLNPIYKNIEKVCNRNSYYLNGGHFVLKDNESELKEIFKMFIIEEKKFDENTNIEDSTNK